jgi:recombination protein RecA
MEIEYFSTGSQLLDCTVGHGWPVGRLINIQGDSASGKTFLASLAANEHLHRWPDCPVWYVDAENAFSMEYARQIKMPVDNINFLPDITTVEEWFKALLVITEEAPEDSHGLMILDSLDSLSDEAERGRNINDASYGSNKAKKLSELFRRINANLARKNITTIVISQLRDQIGSRIAGLKVRSGGKAIEFYSSIVIRLSVSGKVEQTVQGVKRCIGTAARVRCIKNKVAPPFRECNIYNIFERGLDETWTCLEWLKSATGKFNGLARVRIDDKPISEKGILKLTRKLRDLPEAEQAPVREAVREITRTVWNEIEQAFAGSSSSDEDDEVKSTEEEEE